MLQQSGDTGKLFSKSIPVTIKDGYSNQCRNSILFLTVEWQEAAAAIHRQELKISLTDNNDPFFLFNLHLSEEDFQMLKSSQGLLVDFSAFPQKFIDLIEVCLAEDNKVQPKFLLVFHLSEKIGGITSTSQFDIVETNPFKHLVHLSLKFVTASENVIKQYLAVCFKSLKEEKRQLENRLTFLEQDTKDKLSSYQMNLEKKTLELETIRKELSVEMSMKESRHTRELQEEREKFLSKQREEESRTDKERRERESNFRKEIQQLEARVSCLDTLNKDLQDQNHKRDGTIRDLRSRVLSYEEEIKRYKDSIKDLKDHQGTLQDENREKKLHLNHQKEKIEELVQEMKYKKQQIEKLQEQCELHQRHQKALERESEDLQDRFHQRAKECDELARDVAKANDIIEKLQRESQASHEKLRHRTSSVNRLELSVSEKDKIIQMLQKELRDLKVDYKKKSTEVKTLSESVTSMQDKIKTLEKDMKAKDSVIKYLNRELTDRCAIPRYVPPAHLVSPTSTNEALNSAGDPGAINLNNNLFSTEGIEKLKSVPNRISPSKAPVQSTAATADSVYASSPSGNAIQSPTSANSDPSFDLDSAALSAAFGSSQALKHSTAKKFSGNKSVNSLRKKL